MKKSLIASAIVLVGAIAAVPATAQTTADEVRIEARKVSDGDVEFRLDVDGVKWEPRARLFPYDRTAVGRWLRSSPYSLRLPGGDSPDVRIEARKDSDGDIEFRLDIDGVKWEPRARLFPYDRTAVGRWLRSSPYESSDTVENPDRAALVALYNATDGRNWNSNGGWLSDWPLGDWYGVDTDASGRVVRLNLYGEGLTGSIPPELGRLTRLKTLVLAFNALEGPIPPELSRLVDLEYLDISSSALTGGIPPELGRLVNLERLNLSFNALEGPIPPELGDLENLRYLALWVNELEGPIPPELGRLRSLEELWLSVNALTGGIPPELGRLVNLELLDLSINALTGQIPAELAYLTSLNDFSPPGGVCVPAALRAWAAELRVSAYTCESELRRLPSALIREDGNGLSLVLPADLREPSRLTVSDPSVVAASVADGRLELKPLAVGTAQVEVVPSGRGAPAVAEVVVRAAVGTFGIDIVMDHPAPLGYEAALMAGADWWSGVLDGTEWPDREAWCPGVFDDKVKAVADDLLIRAWTEESRSAGYAVTCFRRPSTQAALDPGGGAIVAGPQAANPFLVRHELAHILGLVSWGPESGLVTQGDEHLYFVGPRAVEVFRASGGDAELPGVPFDGVHWVWAGVEDFLGSGSDAKLSAAALADAGYTVALKDPAPPSW